ncbi:hypothetical protein ACE939_00225 [Aquimarina sp. W85]|uniref:hypothetical protein n=1 Tax=Aquimarina rhodophyticola TaxID=3342246 RepID=UPI0036709851
MKRGLVKCFEWSVVGVVLLFTACVKDIDLDQLDAVELSPVYEVAFIFSKIEIPDLGGGRPLPTIGIPIGIVRDTLAYDLLGNEFATKNLDSIALTFEFINLIEKEAVFSFEFLNNSSFQVGQSYSLNIAKGNGKNLEPVVTTKTLVLGKSDIRAITNAKQIATTFIMRQIDNSLTGSMTLRSKGTFYFNYPL